MLNKLFRDAFVYGAAGMLSKSLAWILLPIYVKALSAEEFGAWDLMLTFGILVNLTVALEISQGISRYWNDVTDAIEQKLLASTGLWFSVIMYSLFIVVALGFSRSLNYWLLSDAKYLDSTRLAIFYIGVNGIFLILLNQFRWELRSKEYALISIIYSVMTIFFTLSVFVFFGGGLIGIVLAQLIAAGIGIVMCWWLLQNRYVLRIDLKKLRMLLQFSAPLVPAGIAVFISLYISRFFIKYSEGLEGVARFAFATKVASVVMFLIFALQIALMPIVYRYHEERKTPNQISKLLRWFVSAAIVACLSLSLFSKELIIVIGASDFLISSDFICVLAPAILISQMYIFSPGISIAKKSMLQLWVGLSASIVSGIGNWLMVPLLGLWGASIATLLSAITFLTLWVHLSQKYYYIPYPLKSALISILTYVALVLLGRYLDNITLGYSLLCFFKIVLIFFQCALLFMAGIINSRDINYLMIKFLKKITS